MVQRELKPPSRIMRSRRSTADESGGEEILYPRQPHGPTFLHPSGPVKTSPSPEEPPSPLVPPLPNEHALLSDASISSSPPSAFTPLWKSKRRTSDEFEIDQFGSLVSKGSIPSSTLRDRASLPASKEEKSSARKDRGSAVMSLASSTRERNRDHRGESSANTSGNMPSTMPPSQDSISTSGAIPIERDRHLHNRQLSAGSSVNYDPSAAHSRRVFTTDFSHLPPSPSTTSIHQFLKHVGGPTTATPPLRPPSSSNKESLQQAHPHITSTVAHSLLRGTQEGWSSMDDDAHAEALRKLDGLSNKTARARASIGSLNRLSRPGTPGSSTGRVGVHWEGANNESNGKVSRRGSTKGQERKEEKEMVSRLQGTGHGVSSGVDGGQEPDDARAPAVISGDEHHSSSSHEKTPKKSISARLSFTPKRGSASSTTYTSTTSSRDSASLSIATSATSISAPSGSGRHSIGVGKGRRNSAGSDVSSIYSGGDATALKDRTSSLAGGAEALEENYVPPVPPLPKDLSNYRSPPQSTHGVVFPPSGDGADAERTVSLEVPSSSRPSYLHGLHPYSSAGHESYSAPETIPVTTKTPSKKWSFSNALNIRLTTSPSMSSMKDKDSLQGGKSSSFPLSPRSIQSFSQHLHKRTSKEQALSPATSKPSWTPVQPDAMTSAASLASMSSVGSTRNPKSPGLPPTRSPDRERGISRPGTGSSIGDAGASVPSHNQRAPLSPASSIRRQQSKRLTPSSIPFFRRSSSQSMQISNPLPLSTSPTMPSAPAASGSSRAKSGNSPAKDSSRLLPATPSSTHKKSSVLSLGLPSLLKSSSRRSLHGDKSDAAKELKDGHKSREAEREKPKQDHKDRSESRISVLMGRRRGKASAIDSVAAHFLTLPSLKTLSSTDPKKATPAVTLPPMQMTALPVTTAQRVANLKMNSSTSTPVTPSSVTRTPSSSRVLSQTVSSMQKQSDASLRTRNQLPTIAGSPSVGTTGYTAPKESKDHPPSSLANSIGGLPKETPTKIPRISSRTSAAGSPGLGTAQNTVVNKRISLNVTAPSVDVSPIPAEGTTNEFGMFENGDTQPGKAITDATLSRRQSVRGSPSSSARPPRQASGPPSTAMPRKSNRDSITFTSLRKASTGSVASASSTAAQPSDPPHSHHRFSALSPSKGLKLLSPKISLPMARSSHNNSSSASSVHRAHAGTPSSSRQSLSTPSPVLDVDESELLGDEEMMQYIRRQQAKKMANGATQEELDEMLKFPEPIPPTPGTTPEGALFPCLKFEAPHLIGYCRAVKGCSSPASICL